MALAYDSINGTQLFTNLKQTTKRLDRFFTAATQSHSSKSAHVSTLQESLKAQPDEVVNYQHVALRQWAAHSLLASLQMSRFGSGSIFNVGQKVGVNRSTHLLLRSVFSCRHLVALLKTKLSVFA